MATIQERVQAGADLLDREMPGWDERIELGQLSVLSTCRCVIGQLFAGDWFEGTHRLGFHGEIGEPTSTFACGFDAYTDEEYDILTAAWRDLIAARRLARLTPEPEAVGV